MNALQTVVERNLSSALILEDDVDWDLRIKHQLYNFALSSRALLQPLASNSLRYADPTYPSPAGTEDQPNDFYLDHLPSTIPPSISAYGDGWDVLWLGHCGAQFPDSQDPKWGPGSIKISKGRVIHLNDETVPEMSYLSIGPAEEDPRALYPQHTRFIHHMRENICSFGYAVSQAGARHILYEAGIKKLEDPFDILLRFVCEGQNGYVYLNCLTVQPPLFNQHRPAGKVSAYSDISSWGDEVKDKAETSFVRWSARMNLKKLLDGETDYDDQFPDAV
ncbi:MAG: hypothetical protein M1824_000026 [Vezdaea acicularis]|nr:MAG: hypothetical protein M1824_000026 [Vezdaea acicularis]